MKEKRPLVWLSAVYPALAASGPVLRDWQLIHVPPTDKPCAGERSGSGVRVGVFDLGSLKGDQLAHLPEWLDTIPVQHWVATLEPHQIQSPEICALINRYCKDYHTLPLQADRLNGILGHLLGMSELQAKASRAKPACYHDVALEGESVAIRQVRELLRKFARTEESVLIYGENGTGKEAAARFIHDSSPRRNKPLIAVNCAALPRSLTQNELFGHEKGAFTHAMSAQKGRIEAANGGTLLLIGVDELCSEQQSAILRFLQEGLIERLGSNHPISVDTRLIATSTKPLEQLVKTGVFRSDVFYRLGSLHVLLPPLRERKEDIPVIASRILSSTPSARASRRLTDDALICLASHPWPGNLRELQNRLRQALLLGESPQIGAEDLGFTAIPTDNHERSRELSLDAFRSRADRQAISVSLALAHNNVSAAARLLNISRVSLYRLMDKHRVPHGTSTRPQKDN
ncbi:DNA-binding transcriptional response regulator, NtrC family, contains REC, AAA-type ATPase, and a Fis-type DNA-binding domains [Marinobacter sp. es.042]|uniref:sigma-54 dependent transcriptional regulator n=1 Tax=Marinobacter sp. es.042 TaxID=1761794 RepID=UPI000B50DF9E|nr:sigma-54 dependent transcriptional regulator [Marinobacter sp. es.042]SNB59132.1 DNA-binding transcriptional response regulator, NtrC family, contains REC, AAA-type ATPase, and a Fis-type DNA-binding domains [Marinobacter sp. es.042]